MPLDLPNLDDRRYADLVAEALALIPAHAPEWTNHNASDPGITLIELFASLSEMLIYRSNRLSDDTLRTWLRLIDPKWTAGSASLAEETHTVVASLRRPDRAVSVQDFEALALAAHPGVARSRCFAEAETGRVRLLVVPQAEAAVADVLEAVRDYLKPRRLLTTRVQVEEPRRCGVGVSLTLGLESDALEAAVRADADAALARFFDAERGGTDGRGWPFGRAVYVCELYDLLGRLNDVDHVRPTLAADKPLDELTVADAQSQRLQRNAQGRLVAVKIEADELVRLASSRLEFSKAR